MKVLIERIQFILLVLTKLFFNYMIYRVKKNNNKMNEVKYKI